MKSWDAQISAIVALEEPTRRSLYDYVCQRRTERTGPSVPSDLVARTGNIPNTEGVPIDDMSCL